MDDRQDFGAELRRLRLQRNRSLRSVAKGLRYDTGALSRIENGLRKPSPKLIRDLDAELGAGGSLIRFASDRDMVVPDGISAAAAGSLEFAEWATGDDGQISIDALCYEITRIAASYVHSPPQPLFADLQQLRDHVWRLLRGRPSPPRARELMFLGGVVVALLAQLSGNLGNPIAATQHAMAAERLARQIGHTALLTWIAGTRALIAEWSGSPSRAIEFARQGLAGAPVGEQRVRLAALQARCAARLGRVDEARAAIDGALTGLSSTVDDITGFGGVLSFPLAKTAYYAGTTFRLIGDHDGAEHWANTAIDAYESGPPHERSYGDEALARIDVAIAHIARRCVDDAAEILAPVLALPVQQRIHPVVEGIRQLDQHLHAFPPNRALRQEIRTFTTNTSPTQ